MDEWELLRRFAQEGSQEAFAEVVRRHLDFVYSCARRQVRSPQLAQEVAQAVFLELARQAGTLGRGSPLSSWLYLVTRRAALNVLRGELRRQAREHAAYEFAAMNHEPSVWQKLEPLLDEALETLSPHDRSALLLRYFENKPLREVGAVLGASEDAAQKRVTRALEHLRHFFVKQGVPISAAGLAAHLTTNAVEAAPAALGGLIATGTGSLSASSLAVQTTHAMAMTTLQKSLLAAAVVVLGAGVYEVRARAERSERLAALERDASDLAARENAVRAARDAAQLRLAAALDDAKASAAVPPNPADSAAIASLTGRTNQLKQAFAANPAQRIPELSLVTEEDWVQVARERTVDTEVDRRASLARVRSLGKTRFVPQIGHALRAYLRANPGTAPGTAGELMPFFASPAMTPDLFAMLNRYEIRLTAGGGALISESVPAMPDRDYDFQTRIIIPSADSGDKSGRTTSFMEAAIPGPLAPKSTPFLR